MNIAHLNKKIGDSMNRGIYMGLRLFQRIMKVLVLVVEGLIMQRIEIDEIQCVVVGSLYN